MAMLVYLKGGFATICSPHISWYPSWIFGWVSRSEVKEQIAHSSSPLLGAHQSNAQILKEAIDWPAWHLGCMAAVLFYIVKTMPLTATMPSTKSPQMGLETIHKWMVYDIVLPTFVLLVGPTSPTLTWENCGLKLPSGWAEICFPPKKVEVNLPFSTKIDRKSTTCRDNFRANSWMSSIVG